MESTTMTNGAADARAVTRVWSECPQPVTRRLADSSGSVHGGTLPSFGQQAFAAGTQVAGDKTVLVGIAPIGLGTSTTTRNGAVAPNAVTSNAVAPNYMDTPFRTGRPPA